jgi:CheY-like chemotaxis protein
MPNKRIRVLVVEDCEATAYLIQKAFQARGAKVDWDLCFCKDGQEALDCLFQRGVHGQAVRPDFVLLDWNLPKVNGEEVLRLLRSNYELEGLPVLVFSTSQADRDIQTAYRAHANGYISKPTDVDAFFAVIESIENFWVHTAQLPSAGTTMAATWREPIFRQTNSDVDDTQ